MSSINCYLGCALVSNFTLIDAFYGNEDESGLHNVDVMTDISAPATAFTRYTVAPTSASRTSRYVLL